MGINIMFWILAAMAVTGALMVVNMRSLFRAALGLIMCFLSIAGLFITLSAEYLGIVQILVYIGAIAVLIIMAVVMTREVEHSNLASPYKLPAIASALAFIGIAIWAILNTKWPTTVIANDMIPPLQTHSIGQLLFGQDGLVLAVEIAALLIVVAVIGAVSVAKEK
ncbi:MAG: NADH-quinone oxidoreductase subunit J [Dehalococcoidia bacterium]|nr:NADH-quinone oxidoreductase subunit J [Dehalococcoidia bacterium]